MVDLELKKNRISASEAPQVFNCDLYHRTQWDYLATKKGWIERPKPTMRMLVGKAMERGVLEIYTHLTGRVVEYFDQTILDLDNDFLAATPDAFCRDVRRGVEAKYVFYDQRHAWLDGPPPGPEIQARVCSMVTNRPWDICVFIEGDEPRVYPVERDPEIERALRDYLRQFHAACFIGDAVPPMGRSAQADAYLQSLYPRHKRPDLREAEGDEIQLMGQYLDLLLDERALKGCKAEVATALKAAIKDREGLTCGDARFTWRKQKDSELIDWQSMAIGLLYDAIKDEAGRVEHIKKFTRLIEGKRRIHMHHPALRKGGARGEEEEGAAA